MTDALVVTSGSAWRQRVRGGVVLRLPSGLVARVRGVQPDIIFDLGIIPDTLTPVIAALVESDAGAVKVETFEALKSYHGLVKAICKSALMDPCVVDDPIADNEIGIDDLEYPDRVFLMGTLGASISQLERFRSQQEGAMDSLDAPTGNRKASK